MSEFPEITADEFRRLSEYIYRRTGMAFTEARRYFVERRIAARMAATASSSFAIYFAKLRSDSEGEIEKLINAFTINETYFYREDHQLRCLSNDLLRERVSAKRPGDAVRIWSVPCSTGEEPYSIAIWLLENWSAVDSYNIEIIGSDIDTAVLDAAQEGIYGSRALMRLSPELIAKYFVNNGAERWRLIDELRQSIQFTRANIVDPAEMRAHGKFDVVFCRNLLIYFDDVSRRLAAESLYENLYPGGFICLGHTESMSRISSLFDMCRFADAIVYRRPMEDSNG